MQVYTLLSGTGLVCLFVSEGILHAISSPLTPAIPMLLPSLHPIFPPHARSLLNTSCLLRCFCQAELNHSIKYFPLLSHLQRQPRMCWATSTAGPMSVPLGRSAWSPLSSAWPAHTGLHGRPPRGRQGWRQTEAPVLWGLRRFSLSGASLKMSLRPAQGVLDPSVCWGQLQLITALGTHVLHGTSWCPRSRGRGLLCTLFI